MLKDTTRTISYAKFIMSNPKVFKGATVMDVGCGTGILSSEYHRFVSMTDPIVLAAKAGAKHVYAIEASGLASKARENIKRNGYESVITVIQSKVENVTLPVKQVDVIISEWMVSASHRRSLMCRDTCSSTNLCWIPCYSEYIQYG